MKKLLYGLIGLVIVLVAAVLIVPAVIDWNGYKEEIAAEVRAATGRELAIDGDISVSLLPAPHASVSGIRFANVEGATEPDMLRLEQASADIAFWPLLSGEVEVESVTLLNPEITLETTEDGAVSWDLAPAEGAPAPAETGGDGFDMRLQDVQIENGRVRYLEAGTEVAALEGLDAQLSAESLSGPFSANGSATLNGLPFRFDAGLGALADSPQFALRIMTDAGAGEASVEGSLANGGFAGSIALAAENGQAFIAALAEAAGSDFAAPDMLAGPLSLYTELSAGTEALSADALTVTLGESRLAGHARLMTPPDAAQSFDVALAGERLDLDAILAAMAGGEGGGDAEGDGRFALPADLSGRLALELGTVVFQGDEIAGAVLEARLSDGSLSVERASATLPGGSPVAVQGTLRSEAGAPAFSGSLELSSSAPRTLLGWAQVDVAALPDGALEGFSFSANVDGSPSVVRLDPFSLRLDDSSIQGQLSLSMAATPSLSLSGSVDRLDIDRYLGTGGSGDTGGGNPLAGFNADVNLTFGALSIGGNAYSPVTAIVSVSDGAVTIDQLSGIGPGGTAFSVAGTVSDPSAPAFALDFDVSHPNLPQLLATFGMDGGGAPAVNISAAGRAESDGTQLTVSDLDAQLGDSDIGGTITASLGAPIEVNADLRSQVLNLDTLLPGGGGGGGDGGGERWSREPIDLAFLRGVSGRIGWSVGRLAMVPTGLDNARLEVTLADGVLTIDSLNGSLGGGTVAVTGRIESGDVPSIALSVSGEGVTFEPGVLSIGEVSLDGARIDLGLDVTGTGASMADLVAGLNGNASLSVAGGVINGLNLGAWRDTLNTLGGGIPSLDGVLGTLGGGFDQGFLGGQTPIGSLTGTFQIQGGEVYTDDLTLATDVAAIEMDGAVSLPAWAISALGIAEIRESILDELPAIPFGLGGPLDSPSFQPDFSALQLFLGTDVMGLSLDQLPADILAGLPIQGLSPDMLSGIDPQQLIQALTSGRSVGPEAFQQLLQGGGEGAALAPQPDALLEQFIGTQGGEDDPAAALQRLLTGEPASPESAAVPEGEVGAEGEPVVLEPALEEAQPETAEPAEEPEVVPSEPGEATDGEPSSPEPGPAEEPVGEPEAEEQPAVLPPAIEPAEATGADEPAAEETPAEAPESADEPVAPPAVDGAGDALPVEESGETEPAADEPAAAEEEPAEAVESAPEPAEQPEVMEPAIEPAPEQGAQDPAAAAEEPAESTGDQVEPQTAVEPVEAPAIEPADPADEPVEPEPAIEPESPDEASPDVATPAPDEGAPAGDASGEGDAPAATDEVPVEDCDPAVDPECVPVEAGEESPPAQ